MPSRPVSASRPARVIPDRDVLGGTVEGADALIWPHYPKVEVGRPVYLLMAMLGVHLIAQLVRFQRPGGRRDAVRDDHPAPPL